jgi:hypothetical protein
MLAFGIYIVGVAIILFLRPNLMFRDNGWKEFGLASSGNYTVFPFWMFTLVWAVFSYAVATLGSVFIANLALRSTPMATMPQTKAVAQPVSSLATPAPGYYIVDPQPVGTPRFVYFGSQPPTMANLGTYTR